MDPTTSLPNEAASPLGISPKSERQPLERTSAQAMAALRLELRWSSEAARHTDVLFAAKLNLWRDLLPPELEQQNMGQPVGHRASHSFGSGELMPDFHEGQLKQLRPNQFDRRFTGRGNIQPRAGRLSPNWPPQTVRGCRPVGGADRRISGRMPPSILRTGARMPSSTLAPGWWTTSTARPSAKSPPLYGRLIPKGARVLDLMARMNGIDPYAVMRRAGRRLQESQDPAELDRLLDDIEYLYEALDPELQGLAKQVMERLRERIAKLRAD